MHYDCTDLFIEVNPRHRRYYEVMLGFRRIGGPRTNDAVGAPAQLMWLNVADIRRHIDRAAGESCNQARSLYPHFFSAREEQGIYGRLAGAKEDCSPVIASGIGEITAADMGEKRVAILGGGTERL